MWSMRLPNQLQHFLKFVIVPHPFQLGTRETAQSTVVVGVSLHTRPGGFDSAALRKSWEVDCVLRQPWIATIPAVVKPVVQETAE
jgi:hypothetical protein